MKTVFIVSSLIFVTVAVSANVIPHRFDSVCAAFFPTSTFDGCNVDLTIAIDMSSAMGNTANIATMTNSILADFLPNFNFYETFTAGLSFGSTITSSMYWDNYADMCNFIHAVEEQTIQSGLNYTTLSEVFQNYQTNLQHSGRNYQKILVLLTAKSDPKEIADAKVYADQIMANGVAIIVVALAQDSTSPLSQLGQHFYSTPGYTIPITTIPSVICSYGGQTMIPPTVNPSGPPYNPLSDAIGTPCSTNVSNVWLDIVFVVDISNVMSVRELHNWALETLSYTHKITFGPRGPHKTRAGIITFGTDAVPRLALSDGISKTVFVNEVSKIPNYFNADDKGGYIQKALKAAQVMLNEIKHIDGYPKDIRKQLVILTAAAYSDAGFAGAVQAAQTLKDDGIKIFTINYKTATGLHIPGLDKIASYGYAFQSDMVLSKILPLGLTQVNCFCPAGYPQFSYNNGHNITNYAECPVLNNAPSLPSVVNRIGCPKGSTLALTSQIKLDFIIDNILSMGGLLRIKQILVGAHKNADGNWYWWGYNHTEYPLGQFPVFNPALDDTYAYINNYFGFNWQMVSTNDDRLFPFICQNRACDADFICDQS